MSQTRSLPAKYYGANGTHRVPLWRVAGFALNYWDCIKNNRAIQMLVVSASSDKLATTMRTSTVQIVLFGVIAGDYAIYGTMEIFTNAALAALWFFGDPTSMNNGAGGLKWGYFAIGYIVLTIICNGFQGISGNIVIPMTADYEVYRTGKYVPGMMGTLFSLVDKLISSFAPLLTITVPGLIIFCPSGYC